MKILFELTQQEQDFLKALLENGGGYNLSPLDTTFRAEWKNEITLFENEGLTECINTEAGGSWLTYTLTRVGYKAIEQYNLTEKIM